MTPGQIYFALGSVIFGLVVSVLVDAWDRRNLKDQLGERERLLIAARIKLNEIKARYPDDVFGSATSFPALVRRLCDEVSWSLESGDVGPKPVHEEDLDG